jgi:hypothetical protein
MVNYLKNHLILQNKNKLKVFSVLATATLVSEQILRNPILENRYKVVMLVEYIILIKQELVGGKMDTPNILPKC